MSVVPELLMIVGLLWWSSSEAHTCEFPVYLQETTGPSWWLYRVTHAGAQLKNNTIVYVEISGARLSTTSLSGDEATAAPLSYERDCVDKYEGDTYLVTHFLRGHDVQYVCMKFVKRSSHVVQIFESTNSSERLNCTEESLTLDPWPLIKFDESANETLSCPVHGGYDIELFDRHDNSKCTDKYFVPRLECGCSEGDAVHLDLRACQVASHLVGMEAQQDLKVIASWDDEEYRYTIMKRQRVGLYWSLRTPRHIAARMTGYISADVVCTNGNVTNVAPDALILNLHERIVASICSDVSPYCSPEKCNDHSLFSELYCEDTCGHCENSKKTTCEFPPSARGEWTSVTDPEHPEFTISSDQIVVSDAEIQPCVSHNAVSKTYLLLKFDKKGCSPRYMCLTIKPIAPSVILYKLVPGPAWDPLFRPSMCYTSRKYNLVSEEASFSLAVLSRSDVMVSCELPGSAYAILAVSRDGSACHGRFYKPDCEGSSSGQLILNYTRCLEEEAGPPRRFACLAQLPVYSSRRMVLIRDVESGDLFCLSFSRAISFFELLPGKKCRGSFSQHDAIATIHVTQELTICNTSELLNDTGSRYINYSRPVVRGSYSYSPTVNPDLIGAIKTVKPYMPPDRSNILDRTNLLDDREAKSQYYYRSSVREQEEREYTTSAKHSQNAGRGTGLGTHSVNDPNDCRDKQNADLSRCRNAPAHDMEKNRTVRKTKDHRHRLNETTLDIPSKSGETAKQTAGSCQVLPWKYITLLTAFILLHHIKWRQWYLLTVAIVL